MAKSEHDIEQCLQDTKNHLEQLEPKFDVNSLGVAVMPNSQDLIDHLKSSVQQLHKLQTQEDSAPFRHAFAMLDICSMKLFIFHCRDELVNLENKVIVAYERIGFFTTIETSLTTCCEVFLPLCIGYPNGKNCTASWGINVLFGKRYIRLWLTRLAY